MESTKEQIGYALSLFTSDQKGTKTPFVIGDRIYVTDLILILSLPDREELRESFTEDSDRHPNAPAIFHAPAPTEWEHVRNDRLKTDSVTCRLCGMTVQGRHLNTIYQFGRLAGIHDWQIACYDKYKLIFSANYNGDRVYILLMSLGKEFEDSKRIATTGEDVPASGNRIRWSDGKAYYNEILRAREEAERKKEEAKQLRPDSPFFEVTLARYTTMAVKASTYEEAERIALRYVRDSMFEDSGTEVENYSESTCDSIYAYHDQYYDENGVHEWDEE